MKFLHTMIRVKDIKKSLEFYTELLGLSIAKTLELSDSRLYFLTDKEGSAQIELTENFETPKEGYSTGTGFGHFAFSCKDLEKFEEKMSNLGYAWLYSPFGLEVKGEKGPKIAFLKDPDGNEIELIED